jgi:hypothetical protein
MGADTKARVTRTVAPSDPSIGFEYDTAYLRTSMGPAAPGNVPTVDTNAAQFNFPGFSIVTDFAGDNYLMDICFRHPVTGAIKRMLGFQSNQAGAGFIKRYVPMYNDNNLVTRADCILNHPDDWYVKSGNPAIYETISVRTTAGAHPELLITGEFCYTAAGAPPIYTKVAIIKEDNSLGAEADPFPTRLSGDLVIDGTLTIQ